MAVSDIPIFPTEAHPNIGWLNKKFLVLGNLIIRLRNMSVSTKLYLWGGLIKFQKMIQVSHNLNELTGYKITTSTIIELPFDASREIAIWDALAQSLMIFSINDEPEGFEDLELVYRSNTPDGENPQRLTGENLIY